MSPLPLALLVSLAATVTAAPSPAPATGSWRATLARSAAERDAFSKQLAWIHPELRERVERERPDLVERLESTPPAPVAWGYALLPRIEPVEPASPGEPLEKTYSLAGLAAMIASERAAAQEIVDALVCGPAELEGLVQSYLWRTENLRRVGNHIGYHDLWQDHAHRHTVPWRSELLAAWRAFRSPVVDAASRDRAQAAGERLLDWTTRFTPAPGLGIHRAPCGGCVLTVRIVTDIEDRSFLAVFVEAIDLVWNRAPAMEAAGLRLEIEWDHRRPDELYPEGPPPPGTALELDAHRRRIGYDPPSLTTGAESLHVLGRTIVLSAAAQNGRALAHELGHLLGFWDEYVRVFEGREDDPEGLVIHELIPFPESLLASPGTGSVVSAMVAKLLEAYSEARAESPGGAP